MPGSRRAAHAALLLTLGAAALTGGTVLMVLMAVTIGRMGMHALHALLTWVPLFTSSGLDHPVPQYDFFSPSLAMLGGIALFLIGWVVIIRGVTAAWPDRFARTRATPETHSALLD